MNEVLSFGRLEPVEIRNCWVDEARHFTPWLAGSEGMGLLAKSLGVELELQGVEVPVGPYCADILARDLTTDALLVIENQLEKTDHDHLGKALTYAAVLGAKSVVWVARSFTDEHRKALEWLNELTKGSLLLYGVEIQVWRIGDSAPAPRFDVVCSPNEVVRQAAAALEADEFSPTRQLQIEFWTEVRSALEKTRDFSSLQSAGARSWFDIALGRSGIALSLFANTYESVVGVRLYLASRVADRTLEQLLAQREAIESELGFPLEWNPYPGKKDKVVRIVRPGAVSDKAAWPELVHWLVDTTVAFRKTFRPRIMRLDLSVPAVEVNEPEKLP